MMKNAATLILTAMLGCIGVASYAGTEPLSETGYDVTTRTGEKIVLPNGNSLTINALSHETIVNDKTGEQSSEWCSYDGLLDPKGHYLHYLSYCTRVYDNGDVLWSTASGDNDDTSQFTFAGGTGKFVGATGNGETTTTSTSIDGRATTFKNIGTLTTK